MRGGNGKPTVQMIQGPKGLPMSAGFRGSMSIFFGEQSCLGVPEDVPLSLKLFHGKVWEGTIVAGLVFLPAQVPSQLLLDLLDCILFVGIASCFVAQSPFVLL